MRSAGGHYAEATDRIMRARLAYDDGNFWVADQIALPLAALRLGLRFRELSRLQNHMIFQD